MATTESRKELLSLLVTALDAVSGEAVVRRYFERHPISRSCYLVAIGKAAAAMTTGAVAALASNLRRGLVITKYGHGAGLPHDHRLQLIESGHPLPDEQSLAAGDALLAFIAATPADAQLVFLISGGASSLVEVLPAGMDIDRLRRLNDWLLASGLPIDAMNRVRKSISGIKAGRLAACLEQRPCLSLMLSDVPSDEPAVIGSGLLVPHGESELSLEGIDLPGWISELLQKQVPLPEWSAFRDIHGVLLASNSTARHALAEAGKETGHAVRLHDENYQGDAGKLGRQFAREVIQGEPGIRIWGGESTVRLPAGPGRGGRNQHLALAAAQVLAGHDDCLLLAIGTDGSDGPTEDAGALVDGGTIARGEGEGFDATRALKRADAGTFLEASGDLIQTGPTGTNVMDLVIGLKIT